MKYVDRVTRVEEIDHSIARPFIEQWHYSGYVPKGSHHFFAWFVYDELYAVADYGNGVNPYQVRYLKASFHNQVTDDNLLELKRLCRSEPKRLDFPLTAFLKRCHRLLKNKGICFVVAFSDPEYGHSGGIYRAANFEHFGKTQYEKHTIDKDGVVHHRRYAYRYARRNGISIQEARDILGLQVHETVPKDRWVRQIGNV